MKATYALTDNRLHLADLPSWTHDADRDTWVCHRCGFEVPAPGLELAGRMEVMSRMLSDEHNTLHKLFAKLDGEG